MRVFWISLVAVFLSFSLGYLLQEREAVAAVADPPVCPKQTCVEMYAWWNGNQVQAAYLMLGAAHEDAWKDTFTQNAGWDLPFFAGVTAGGLPSVWIDVHSWNFCIPHCWKDGLGVWQARQEVTPDGVRGALVARRRRDHCAPYNGAPGGNQILPPVNDNPNQGVPPRRPPD